MASGSAAGGGGGGWSSSEVKVTSPGGGDGMKTLRLRRRGLKTRIIACLAAKLT
jgi:hypothetical protein